MKEIMCCAAGHQSRVTAGGTDVPAEWAAGGLFAATAMCTPCVLKMIQRSGHEFPLPIEPLKPLRRAAARS